jgi:hypothetical protein
MEYYSIPHSTVPNPEHLDENTLIVEVLNQFKPFIDCKKLLKSGNVDKILAILHDLASVPFPGLLELEKSLKKSIKCPSCSENCSVVHSCLGVLCRNCTKTNNYACITCKQTISEGYINDLYGHTRLCNACKYNKVYTENSEMCLMCAAHQLRIDNNTLFLERNRSLVEMHLKCFECSQSFYLVKDSMVAVCPDHFFCCSCGAKRLLKGTCACKKPIEPKYMLPLYEKLFTYCSHCKDEILKNEVQYRSCCQSTICKFCRYLDCENCLDSLNDTIT